MIGLVMMCVRLSMCMLVSGWLVLLWLIGLVGVLLICLILNSGSDVIVCVCLCVVYLLGVLINVVYRLVLVSVVLSVVLFYVWIVVVMLGGCGL